MENRIKEYRMKKGMTQKEVAEAIKIALSTYSNYEAGRATPPVDVAFRIAQALDVTAYDIWNHEPVPSSGVQALRDLFSVMRYADVSIEPQEECTSVELIFRQRGFCEFLEGYSKMAALLNDGTIDQSVYDTWLTAALIKFEEEKLQNINR